MPYNTQNYLSVAYRIALRSPDPSTQNGSFLIPNFDVVPTSCYNSVSAACNEFPEGVRYSDERWEKPLKYQVIEHAERNSIYKAARAGTSTEGKMMVCCWATCADCARAIIQAGISKLVTHKQSYDRSPDYWKQSISIAFTMLEEAGVEVELYDGYIGAEPIRHSGELWSP